MNLKLTLSILIALVLGAFGLYLITKDDDSHVHEAKDGHSGHGNESMTEPEVAKGPHGGRLLKDSDFTLELAIYEGGVPPEFRAWFSRNSKPIAPDNVKLTVELKRPGGKVDVFHFSPKGDFAQGDAEVEEPHSFDYIIVAEHGNRSYRWAFEAPEMQTIIEDEDAQRSGVLIDTAGPTEMTEILSVYGQVKLNGNQIARATPRYGGMVIEASKDLGDMVKAGELVAIVESNQTLVTLEVKAPIAGVIIDRNVQAGETVIEGTALYTIANLAEVWINLNVPKLDQARVKIGQSVTILADDGGPDVRGKIARILPISSGETQTVIAQVELPNSDGRWRPGLFIKAEISIGEYTIPVAVKHTGIQTLFDFTVVFTQHGNLYQARPLELGRRANGYVEVLKGLHPGERYVVDNSFLIKADIGKSGATHDH
jgi:cobalt-zinc-cadmium efflux system membrane fusion protein